MPSPSRERGVTAPLRSASPLPSSARRPGSMPAPSPSPASFPMGASAGGSMWDRFRAPAALPNTAGRHGAARGRLRACARILPGSAAGPGPKGPQPCRRCSCRTQGRARCDADAASQAGRPGAAWECPATSRACAGPDPGLRTPSPSPSPLHPLPPPHRPPPLSPPPPLPSRIPGGPAVPPPAGRLPTKKGAGRECRTKPKPAHAARMRRPPRPDEGAG